MNTDLDRKKASLAGTVPMAIGVFVAAICFVVGGLAVLMGGTGGFIVLGVIPGLLLVVIGYLKRIAAVLLVERIQS